MSIDFGKFRYSEIESFDCEHLVAPTACRPGKSERFGNLQFSLIQDTASLTRNILDKKLTTLQEKRPRGRPQVRSDDETRQVIIDAANEQFMKAGYASANITAIATTAGVSTKTLYRLFPTKADLFSEVIDRKIGIFFLKLDEQRHAHLDLLEGVEHLLIAYGRLTLSLDTITITRLVLGESERFPEIAALFYNKAISRTGRAMEQWLAAQCASHAIHLDDVAMATGMLRGMMTMEPQRAVMLGQMGEITDEQIVARAKACAKLFLDGCRS